MRASSTRRRSPPDSTPIGCSMRFGPMPEPGRQGAGLAVGGVAAVRAELLLGAGVAGHVALVGALLHGDAELLDALQLGVDAAAGEDVGDGGAAVEHAGDARVLRQVAEARPCGRPRPADGSVSPPSTRNRLVLPAPLRPTRPTLSRGMTVKSADSTTSRPPTSTESACAWSTCPGCQASCGVPTTLPVRRVRAAMRSTGGRCRLAATGSSLRPHGRAVATARRRRAASTRWSRRGTTSGGSRPPIRAAPARGPG